MYNKFTRDGPWDWSGVVRTTCIRIYVWYIMYLCIYIYIYMCIYKRKVSLTFISLPIVRGGSVFSFIIFRFSSPSSRLSSSAVRRRFHRRRTRPPSCAVSYCSLLFPRQRWSATHVFGWFSPLTWFNNVSEQFYYYFYTRMRYFIID